MKSKGKNANLLQKDDISDFYMVRLKKESTPIALILKFEKCIVR